MKKYFLTTKKPFSTLALGCALVVLAAPALVNCTDPAPPATFTVKFDTNGGEPAVKDKTVENGKLLAKPATEPTKKGFSFAGWYKDKALSQAFDFNAEKITQNITLYARWIEAYIVTFDAKGGTNVDQQTVVSGKTASRPSDPTREGYTFENWYSDEALATPFDFDANTVTQNITLYAKWAPITYTVTFNLNGGTPNEEDKTVAHGERVQQPSPNPTKTDSVFAGWYKDEKLTQKFDFDADSITANTALYAKWKSNLVDIPDANFRKKLQALIPGAFEGEKLNATSDEVTGRASLEVTRSNIGDLTGIRYFTALTRLYCRGNQLTALDVSANTALTELDCNTNNLTALDVSKNTALTALDCHSNNLTALDVSANTALTQLYCTSNNLTALDVSANTVITTLYCASNNLTALDVSANTVLTTLYCSSNNLTVLDVSNNTALTALYCIDNQLAGLDVSNNTALTELYCTSNNLTVLDVSKNTALTALDCSRNQLAALDVSVNTALTTLSCAYNRLTHLDMRGMRSVELYFSIQAASNATNVIDTLKVHENLKDHEEIKKVKTARGDKVTVETYSAAAKSTEYMLICSDYDPTVGSEADRCGDEVKYTVTFNSRGGSLVNPISLYREGPLSKPTNPTKGDSTFAGWYNDEALSQAFDFDTETITADITLHAKWIIAYTVAFNLNGGTPNEEDKIVEAGTLLTQPSPNPTKEGNTFAGWYNDEALSQAFDFDTEIITADITLYAKWTPITYTVTFNLNGGTPNEDDKTVAHGEKVQQPQPDPTKTDSLFTGWYKDQALTQRFQFSTEKITQPITLYAKWEYPTGVTIPDANFRKKLQALIPGAFEGEKLNTTSDDVTGLKTLDVSFSNIRDLTGIHYFTALTELYCSGNQLAGLDVSNNTALTELYCSGNNLTALDVSNNTALTELYCGRNQLAALDVSNNTALTELYCGRNQLAALDVSVNTALTTLSCAYNRLTHLDMRGMRSVGLDFSIQGATGETNVIDTLKVHENLKDHEQIGAVKTARGNKVTVKTYSAVAKSTEYTLACIDYDPTAGSEVDRCGDEVKYTVTFNSHGGSLVNPIPLYREGPLAKPTNPTKTDSTFAGWYKDETLSQAFDFDTETITADITLHAKWIITYTVSFNLNGGTPNEEDKIVEAGTLLTQPSPNPTKEGNTFAGWYNDEALSQAFDFDTEIITADITLYAKWTPITYTVTFSLNGGTPNEEDKTLAHGERVQQPKPDPTKTDSVFAGWHKDEELTQRFQFYTEKITADITLYAKWEYPTRVTIPDANFRKKLQALIPGAFEGEKLNTTSDEVTGRTNLNVSFSNIGDLTGIRYFTALTQLYCSGNQLAGLDVSNNTALTELLCRGNQLAGLDVSKNTALTQLYCNTNNLTALDVSNNTALTTLSCTYNRLTHLDVRGMRSVKLDFSIQGATGETNVIDTLKVHENLKDHEQIGAVKTARGNKVTVKTYSAATGSTVYTAVCNDYDPTETNEQDRCKDTP